MFSDKGVENGGITLVDNNVIISDDHKVAETLNNFFCNAVASLNVNIDSSVVNVPIEAVILKYSNHPSVLNINKNVKKVMFSFLETDLESIEEVLKALNEKKVCISSSIPPKILKENRCICAGPLTYIINSGISNGKFDDGFKMVDLIPLYKLDAATNKQNYQNISLLPVISKIFEKVVKK